MSTQLTLPLDDQAATLETVGGKGASLARMANASLPVPGGYHITTEAYRRFVFENALAADIQAALEQVNPDDPASLESASAAIHKRFKEAEIPAQIAGAIVEAYHALPGISPAVAVRSSATAEDLPEASFAGQQETYLNIAGADAVLEAVRLCWASLWTARAIGYRAKRSIPAESVAIAVVVQLLIPAEVSGILFTANPVNGSREQMLVNASWGLGEAVVGGEVTPDSLTLEKETGRVLRRETAHKLVQTVRIDGGVKIEEIPKKMRNLPTLNDAQAGELRRLGLQIEALYDMPMDIEWALTDGRFAILQARPITALPETQPAAPGEWDLPEGAYAAMRNNIVELMTDPLTPLFGTFGLDCVNTSLSRLMDGFMSDIPVLPEEPIIAVNQFAYYNGSVKFAPMFKIMLHVRDIMKRMLTGAVERWTEDGRPRYLQTIESWERRKRESGDWRELSCEELLQAGRTLAEAAVDAYGALVSGVIPAAWMSEAWFTLAYRLVQRRDDPSAPVYLMGYDSLPILAEKALYDLARWVREIPGLAAYLEQTPAEQLAAHLQAGSAPAGLDAGEWQAWYGRFSAHLQKYGAMIYNLDFGNPVPADDPAPVLETLKLFTSGEGANPHERQQAAAERREQAAQRIQARLKGSRLGSLRLRSFEKNLHRAQKFAPLREDGLAEVGLSYPLLRQVFGELGRRFAQGGMIAQADDVFWLTKDEVEAGAKRLDRGETLEDLSGSVTRRKTARRAAQSARPPMGLFQVRAFGRTLLRLKMGGARERKGKTLKGVGASPGSVTAPACVLHGPQDFAQMKTGDVLVASLTTPAWTPLFARASAVVTDIGGPLSHGSIVAREYGIPAVLGTDTATRRIRSGQTITVDGSKGVVVVGG